MLIVRKGDVHNRIYGAIRYQKVVVKHHIRYCCISHASEHAHRRILMVTLDGRVSFPYTSVHIIVVLRKKKQGNGSCENVADFFENM